MSISSPLFLGVQNTGTQKTEAKPQNQQAPIWFAGEFDKDSLKMPEGDKKDGLFKRVIKGSFHAVTKGYYNLHKTLLFYIFKPKSIIDTEAAGKLFSVVDPEEATEHMDDGVKRQLTKTGLHIRKPIAKLGNHMARNSSRALTKDPFTGYKIIDTSILGIAKVAALAVLITVNYPFRYLVTVPMANTNPDSNFSLNSIPSEDFMGEIRSNFSWDSLALPVGKFTPEGYIVKSKDPQCKFEVLSPIMKWREYCLQNKELRYTLLNDFSRELERKEGSGENSGAVYLPNSRMPLAVLKGTSKQKLPLREETVINIEGNHTDYKPWPIGTITLTENGKGKLTTRQLAAAASLSLDNFTSESYYMEAIAPESEVDKGER